MPLPRPLQVLAQQGRARAATMKLPHYTAETPMFMPVGTQGDRKCQASWARQQRWV
jgi:queuine tRNA-ribosyltransferase